MDYYIISIHVDYAPEVFVREFDPIVKFTHHKSDAFIFSDPAPFYEVLMTYNSTGRTIVMLSVKMPDIDLLSGI